MASADTFVKGYQGDDDVAIKNEPDDDDMSDISQSTDVEDFTKVETIKQEPPDSPSDDDPIDFSLGRVSDNHVSDKTASLKLPRHSDGKNQSSKRLVRLGYSSALNEDEHMSDSDIVVVMTEPDNVDESSMAMDTEEDYQSELYHKTVNTDSTLESESDKADESREMDGDDSHQRLDDGSASQSASSTSSTFSPINRTGQSCPPPQIGDLYHSWSEFSDYLKVYQAQTYQVFIRGDTKTVTTVNKVRPNRQLPQSLNLAYAKVTCAHYGEKKITKIKSITGKTRPNQSTLKTGCKAAIILSARWVTDENGEEVARLKVVDVNLEHNHDLSQERYACHPQTRRLNAAERRTLSTLVDMQIDTRVLQRHIKRQTNKLVKLKDIQNLRASQRNAKDDWSLTMKYLEKLCQDDPDAVVEVLVNHEDNTLEMLIIQTSQMRTALEDFPEIVQMDGTYTLNKAEVPLYALMVEDKNGNGRLAAVVLTRGGANLRIDTMLNRVKSRNPSLAYTQVFIVDKDFSDSPAIKKELPGVQIYLSSFHVMKVIRKEIVKSVPKTEQSQALSLVHSLVHSPCQKSFEHFFVKIEKFSDLSNYLQEHWIPIRDQWVLFARNDFVTLGSTTNKRTESHFGEIKDVFSSKRRFSQCIRLLIAVLSSSSMQVASPDYEALCKKHYRNGFRGPESGFFNICTPYAVRKILSQVPSTGQFKLHFLPNGEHSVENVATKETHTLDENLTKCPCAFYHCMRLPCRHIIFARKARRMPVVDTSLVDERWLLANETATLSGGNSGTNGNDAHNMTLEECLSNDLSQKEKYTKTMELAKRLAVSMSESNNIDFARMYFFLKKSVEKCEAGQSCILLEEEDVQDGEEDGDILNEMDRDAQL